METTQVNKKGVNDFGRKGWGMVIFVLFLFLISSAAANGVIVPILTAVRACTFIIMPIVLGATHGNYQIWHIVLGIIACVALLFVCLMSNNTIGKTEAGLDENTVVGE